MSAEDAKVVRCKSCGREVQVPSPDSEGHPYGWYSLSVGVPAWYNTRSDKHYRWVGIYCSADCLGDGVGDVRAEEIKEGHAYDHE